MKTEQPTTAAGMVPKNQHLAIPGNPSVKKSTVEKMNDENILPAESTGERGETREERRETREERRGDYFIKQLIF